MPPIDRRQFLAAGLAASATGLSALSARAEDGTEAAQAVLRRFIGAESGRFTLSLSPVSTAKPWHQTEARGGRVSITGSDPVALTRGAYSYLTSTGAASMSWEGDQVSLPRHLADHGRVRRESPFRYRAYMNTCTFGYTTPWWDEARWRREIDWMALHGINLPLAMEGQEYVWQALWREQGLSDAELAAYFSGPAFTPWQRMGNIEGYDAPLPQAWILKKRDLQKKILAQMRALGMTPVLPAFGGYVPRVFAEKHPEARIYRMRAWEGFHETWWLDPADPLFAKLAGRFLDLYTEVYGAGTHYLADAFNEMLPPVAQDPRAAANSSYGDATANAEAAAKLDPALKAQRLADYGAALYASVAQARPGAVWVMQGWLFGADKAFWDADAIAAFLSRIPDEKMMILDIGNDRYPDVWTRAEAFRGKSWIYGYVHNYGGSNPVYGDLGFYRDDLQALTRRDDTGNLSGFGVFPEGLDTNSIVYEYLYDLAWGDAADSQNAWLHAYLRARYGQSPSPGLMAAWNRLIKASYQTRYWTPRWWKSRAGAYLFFKRPTLDAVDFGEIPGDHHELGQAVDALILSADDLKDNYLFVFDLIEAVRHYVSGEIDGRIGAAIRAYASADVARGDALNQAIGDLALRLDALLGHQPDTLTSWTKAARDYGDAPQDKAAYVENARAQITVWGGSGNLNDYASKAWQGMYASFYLPRWRRFFDRLHQSAAAKTAFDQDAFTAAIIAWEHDWVKSDAGEELSRPSDPIGDARALMRMTRTEQGVIL